MATTWDQRLAQGHDSRARAGTSRHAWVPSLRICHSPTGVRESSLRVASRSGREGGPSDFPQGTSSDRPSRKTWSGPASLASKRGVHERNPDLERVRHAGPVGVPQELVPHVEARLERGHPGEGRQLHVALRPGSAGWQREALLQHLERLQAPSPSRANSSPSTAPSSPGRKRPRWSSQAPAKLPPCRNRPAVLGCRAGKSGAKAAWSQFQQGLRLLAKCDGSQSIRAQRGTERKDG